MTPVGSADRSCEWRRSFRAGPPACNRHEKSPHVSAECEPAPIQIETEPDSGHVSLPLEQGHPVRAFRPVGLEKDGELAGREPERGMMRGGELPCAYMLPELEPVANRVEQAMPGPHVPEGVAPGVIDQLGFCERVESGGGKMLDQERLKPVDDPALAVPMLECRIGHEIAGWLGPRGGGVGR